MLLLWHSLKTTMRLCCGVVLEERAAARASYGRQPQTGCRPRAEWSGDPPRRWVLSRKPGQPSAPRGLSGRRPWCRWSSGRLVVGREDPKHPYLARQMSDFGIRKPLIGSNSGVRAEISTYPARLLAIFLSLARRAQRDRETHQFFLVRAKDELV